MALSACIALWLSANGYQPAQRDAVLKQLWTESRFEPCVVGSGGAYLPQWSGARRRREREMLGPGCPSWDKQLWLVDWELRNEPSFQAFWTADPARAYHVLRETFGRGGIAR